MAEETCTYEIADLDDISNDWAETDLYQAATTTLLPDELLDDLVVS
jgi:hypothetical protein